ncbi:MAG: nitroreductase family protein [Coriobacteriia bacterium]|nr:nitroreductase family protein [Coriobacteriia bacterium]
MTIEEAIHQRHSVRQYTDEPISTADRAALEAEIARCNKAGDLHMTLVCDEPEAFGGGLAHYGSFRGVTSYIVIAGKPADDLEERAGYYGEKVVLLAQQLGLNTCWVALTFKKRLVRESLAAGEKLVIVISVGHGATQGMPHKSRGAEAVSSCPGEAPDWFARGVEFALLAPTAVNQQKFRFELLGADPGADDLPRVKATAGRGACANVDLGIAKLHFELGAGRDAFAWA